MTDRSTIAPPPPAAETVPPVPRGAPDHFAAVAPRYRSLRITDHGPLEHIAVELTAARVLAGARRLVGLDVGAGSGRYTEALGHLLGYRGAVMAADMSFAMLTQGGRADRGCPGRLSAVCADSAGLPVRSHALDFVTTFNAVHHFHLPRFVEEMRRVLRPGGELFVYTRTPEQNGQSVWGRHFPGFAARERRLYCEATLRDAFAPLGPVRMRPFSFERSATLAQLAERVRGGSYSTFALYPPDELEMALARFLGRFAGSERVTWTDQNLLVQVTLH